MKMKGVTISEFIDILKKYPQDAKIGILDYYNGEMYGTNNIHIWKWNEDINELEDEKCDYYIF